MMHKTLWKIASYVVDVIAFPKTQSASSLMTGAPTYVGDEQLKEIHIKNDK